MFRAFASLICVTFLLAALTGVAPSSLFAQPPAKSEVKPVGKWSLKYETTEITIELAADGSGKYNYNVGDKAFSVNAKLKDDELRIDYGKGTFLIYTAKFREDKLILTAGNLKENQELQFAKVNANPPIAHVPPIAPVPMPKPVEPVSLLKSDKSGLGAKYGARDPLTAVSKKEPLKGAPSAEQVRAHIISTWEKEQPNALASELWLLEDVKVESVGKGRPYDRNDGLNTADVTELVYDVRGSVTYCTCYPIGAAYAKGENCKRVKHSKAEGICYKTTFGEWKCYFGNLGRGEVQPGFGAPPKEVEVKKEVKEDAVDKGAAVKALRGLGGKVFVDEKQPGKPILDVLLSESDPAALKVLKEFKSLECLVINKTQITDAGLKELKELKNLQRLDIINCSQVTDTGLKELKELKSLTSLTLIDMKITDVGLKDLKELKNLTGLSLSDTEITDAGLKELKELKNLRSLYLRNTKVTDAGVKELKEALPELKIMR